MKTGKNRLPTNLFWRTKQFPVNTMAERVGKRKRPSVFGKAPMSKDFRGSRAFWGWFSIPDPKPPPTQPQRAENGLGV